MLQRYSIKGQRKFPLEVCSTKLGEWGVVSSDGDFARWVTQESAFRAALTASKAELVEAGNAFSLSYYELLKTFCAEEGTVVVCPGEHTRVLHAAALTATTCTWADAWKLAPDADIVVVLSERVTHPQWLTLLGRTTGRLTLVGDPETRLRLWERGSPMDGFEIACRELREPIQALSWPMFESDASMVWQYRATASILEGATPDNVDVVVREDALTFVLSSISKTHSPYCIPETAAILWLRRCPMDELRLLHAKCLPGHPAAIPVLDEAGPLVQWSGNKVTLGKKEFELDWPCTLERLNICEGHRYIGTPVKKLFLAIDEFTSRRTIAAMLKYATEDCTLIVDAASFSCKDLPA